MSYFMNDTKKVKRGDIFYVSNSKYYATNPNNDAGRPGVVVSCDELNEHADCVEVVYLTTKDKKPMPTHAPVLCKIPSTALCETIYTVGKDRLGDYVRTCSDAEMAAIEQGIIHSLGICADTEKEVDTSTVIIEKNLYKSLYEQLLDRMTAR